MKKLIFFPTIIFSLLINTVSVLADFQPKDEYFNITGGIELDKDFTSTFDKTKTITGTAPAGSVVSIFVYEKLPDNKQELILIDSYTITVGLTGYFTKTIDLVVGENIINIDFSKDKFTSYYSTTINRKKSEIKNELQQFIAIHRAIR